MTQDDLGYFVSEVIAIPIEDIIGGLCELRSNVLQHLHEELFWNFCAAKLKHLRWLTCQQIAGKVG